MYYLASDIRTNVVMLNNWSYHEVNVNMSFTCRPRTCDQTAVCVFWDFTLEMWSSEGCVTQVTDGITQCICNHLTSFAVLMMDSESDDSYNDAILSCITKVGLCLSCASLLLCITIQIILLRKSKNSAVYRHVSILHISTFLLIFNISFLASDLIKPDIQDQLCVAFTFSSHFSLLGFFCWTLVQGIFLVCRLVFVFHHVTKTEFLVLSIVLGYACPLVISLGTFLVYFPHQYRMNETCWLDKSSGASMAFSVPTVIIIVVNFLILILVIHKLLRPSISEGNREDEEVVKKLAKAVLFCTPQFGLTWAIGIPMFAGQKDLYLQYLFVLLNPLQGFFILLFACLLDKKVMDLLKKDFLRRTVTGSSVRNNERRHIQTMELNLHIPTEESCRYRERRGVDPERAADTRREELQIPGEESCRSQESCRYRERRAVDTGRGELLIPGEESCRYRERRAVDPRRAAENGRGELLIPGEESCRYQERRAADTRRG
ncbi:adhesion G-protein coupled receptor F1-like [Ranitomeya variabilis]|uniref:adhesion G-protein coupled receptor F1-like n=1 Tax=Ranitomeya variabilis TaxID=490064 RepID=UPI0040561188